MGPCSEDPNSAGPPGPWDSPASSSVSSLALWEWASQDTGSPSLSDVLGCVEAGNPEWRQPWLE